MIWNVSTPNVCSTTRPTPAESGLTSNCAARACRSCCSVCCGVRSCASSGSVGAELLSTSDRMSTVGSGGSEFSAHWKRASVPRDGRRDPVGLARRPGPRLRLEVEERLDLRRVAEVDGAPRDQEALALEEDLAPLDLGAAEQQRLVVGAAQRQVGARHDPRHVVVDPQRRRRDDADVEPQREVARRRRRGDRRRTAGELEEVAGRPRSGATAPSS